MTPKLVFNLLAAWGRLVGPDNYSAASDLNRRKASFANGIQFFSEYADGSSAPNGIVAANWNDATYYNKDMRNHEPLPGRLESRLCKVFEKLGVKIEWSDTVSYCNDCNKCIQTEPSHWSWQPAFIVDDNGYHCSECAKDL